MPLTSAEFNQLRAFLAVAEHLNFSRAAASLGVTPSALSQTIRALEQDIGQQMFQRTTRSVSLTEAGTTLRDRIAPAASALDQALRQSRDAGARPAGTVRIVSFRSAVERFIVPRLAEFHAMYPEIILDIVIDDRIEDPVASGFDLALRIGEVIEQDLIALRLSKDLRQIAVATPDYLARHGKPRHPRELLEHDCILWRWPGQPLPYAWEFFEDGRWFDINVNGPVIFNDKGMTLDAALSGVGIAFCVEDTVRAHIHAGRLMPLLEDWSETFPGFFLCYPKQRHMAAAVRAFIEVLRKA